VNADFITVCEQAAKQGGAELLDWVGRFSATEKGPSDLVTQADLASQQAVQRLLLDRFPTHRFLGEEDPSTIDLKSGYCWVVDPLDGTTNYVHRIPHFAVSIALVKDGQPIVATVYDPINQECFSAEAGAGASLNGRRIQTSPVVALSDAVVAASFSARVDPDSPEIDQFVRALLACQGVRRTGSAALNMCYVACGRFDAFWALTTKPWDVAAGQLLIHEAGGVVSHYTGLPFDLAMPHPAASATSQLHESFIALLLHDDPAAAGRCVRADPPR
jgi:myo-inositol-1(or 4)-monophosphatase